MKESETILQAVGWLSGGPATPGVAAAPEGHAFGTP
jgi:hypothetical protein